MSYCLRAHPYICLLKLLIIFEPIINNLNQSCIYNQLLQNPLLLNQYKVLKMKTHLENVSSKCIKTHIINCLLIIHIFIIDLNCENKYYKYTNPILSSEYNISSFHSNFLQV